MTPPVALTGLVLDTPLLAAMTDFYAEAFGLSLIDEGPDHAMLAGGGPTNAPQLTLRRAATARLGGLTFAMRSLADVDAARTAARAAQLDIVTTNGGFTLADPDGNKLTFEVDLPRPLDAFDGPLFVSHVVLNSTDPERLIAFYVDQLGFTVSDKYEKGLLTFLRCDQPQHHCVGVAPAATSGLNHFAIDCGDIDRVMRGVHRMVRHGHPPIWGPGRHGPGGNIFAYFEDPTGFVPEYTCDVLQIADAGNWTPKEWARTPENGNSWGSGGPSPRAVELMNGTAFPASAAQ